jgi:hypothetical protein
VASGWPARWDELPHGDANKFDAQLIIRKIDSVVGDFDGCKPCSGRWREAQNRRRGLERCLADHGPELASQASDGRAPPREVATTNSNMHPAFLWCLPRVKRGDADRQVVFENHPARCEVVGVIEADFNPSMPR